MKNLHHGIRLLLLLSAVVSSQVGFAHNALKSSTPADDAVVDALPESMELVFSDATYLVAVEITGANGEPVALDFESPLDYSRQFRVPLPLLEPGRYTVVWKVEGQDTHVIEGQFTFTLQSQPAEKSG